MRHLYVHVPFCVRRCSYCDFSIAVRKRVPAREYVDAVRRELALVLDNAPGWTNPGAVPRGSSSVAAAPNAHVSASDDPLRASDDPLRTLYLGEIGRAHV